MRRHSGLKVLSIAASGYDWLDVEAATQNGIVVTNAPVQEGVEVVADMTWALLLATARQIPHYHQRICAGNHERGMGVAVWQKTLGIVGLGQIGRAVAKRATGFDMRVLAVEPQPDLGFTAKHGIELVSLEKLLRESDFVSLHVRLEAGTRGMIGARELALMKPTAFLINAARQQLVDETALTDAILHGRLAGAGLDDPPLRADTPLRDHPGVVFAPHHGNRATEGVHAVFRCAVDNALAVLTGRRPEGVVNPAVYARRFRAAAQQ
jgi:D-3-phosphoglycerate dehydrogenase